MCEVRYTTAGEMMEALGAVPPDTAVVICADLQGEWMQPFPGFQERAVVFGYYEVDKVCIAEEAVLMTGAQVAL